MAWRAGAGAGTLTLLGLFALGQAARLEVGSVSRPGPGFFPLVLAAGLVVVGAALLVGAWRARPGAVPAAPPDTASAADAPPEAPAPRRPWALVGTLVALAVYVAVFERAGFVVATTGLLTVLFGALAGYRWPLALGAATAIALLARLVFDTWLHVRLPPDVWSR